MKISGIQVSEREYKCARALARHYNHDADCLFFRYIAELSGLDERQTRIAVRSLARKGLAKYTRGLFDEDGMVAGSGYCATSLCAQGFDFCGHCEEHEVGEFGDL